MVLIQGTGAVRAGVWARSVCINESIEKGSMLPLLHAAALHNMSVIVFNPNLHRHQGQAIPYCHTMESHSLFAWKKYVSPTRFRRLFIVAHSAGGSCLASIQKMFSDEFYIRVGKVALTDSWTIDRESLTKEQHRWMI